MPRRPSVPAELKRRPFTLAEGRRAGLSRSQLRSKAWRRVGVGVYVWAGVPDSPLLAIAAVAARLPRGGALTGRASLYLHGLDVAPGKLIEVMVPNGSGVSARDLWVSRARLQKHETVIRHGMPVTAMPRTLNDLARRLPLTEAVVLADMALHHGLVEMGDLCPKLAKHCEPAAESAMESQLRMILVLAGLPRPEAQVSLHDEAGRLLGRADLYYPSHRLVIEYDGGNHRDRLVDDNRRQNALQQAGHPILRFTAPDVLGAPASVAAQVRAVLRKRAAIPAGDTRVFMKTA